MYHYNMCHCRWCGIEYTPTKYVFRDGFCCTAHKQAHHRAYNRYVTRIDRRRNRSKLPVTHKKHKTSRKDHDHD